MQTFFSPRAEERVVLFDKLGRLAGFATRHVYRRAVNFARPCAAKFARRVALSYSDVEHVRSQQSLCEYPLRAANNKNKGIALEDAFRRGLEATQEGF